MTKKDNETEKEPLSKRRGFGAMSPERRREIAAKGGKGSAPEDRAFARDPALASEAARASGKQHRPETRYFTQMWKERGGETPAPAPHKRKPRPPSDGA